MSYQSDTQKLRATKVKEHSSIVDEKLLSERVYYGDQTHVYVRLKNAFLFLMRSFIVYYQKVMNNHRESVDKKGIVLVKLPIKCSQVIELQLCNSSSKPPRNTFF